MRAWIPSTRFVGRCCSPCRAPGTAGVPTSAGVTTEDALLAACGRRTALLDVVPGSTGVRRFDRACRTLRLNWRVAPPWDRWRARLAR